MKSLFVQNNYKIFLEQCQDILKEYPGLSLKDDKPGHQYLKGILDIKNDDSEIVGHYFIEIHFSPGFPYRFPLLFELGEAIPNEADWHKYEDGSCCLTVLPDEIIKCKAGITVQEFIHKYCISFFANHIHKKKEGYYLNGEYSHGIDGLKEFYSELLQTNDPQIWKKYFEYVFGISKIKCERNKPCLCDSGVKFKNCHLRIFSLMQDIGYNQCRSNLLLLGVDIN